jgi:hypothetical protein
MEPEPILRTLAVVVVGGRVLGNAPSTDKPAVRTTRVPWLVDLQRPTVMPGVVLVVVVPVDVKVEVVVGTAEEVVAENHIVVVVVAVPCRLESFTALRVASTKTVGNCTSRSSRSTKTPFTLHHAVKRVEKVRRKTCALKHTCTKKG